jgi:quinolinate synthase
MVNLVEEIQKLKKEKRAVVLAHYYQCEDVKDVADFVGDSFELAKKAGQTDAEMIVFCGVKFMAESAKLLSPQKTVYLAESTAGCPMADMLKAEDILELRKKYPEAAVVTYINSSVEAKAYSDVCCTSSSAIKIISNLPHRQIIFLPDKNLGAYVARFTDKEIILYSGFCPTHDRITLKDVNAAKAAHPEALVAVHPECRAEVIDAADFCGSTSQIINFCETSSKKEFIIGTETGVVEQLKRSHKDKFFYPLREDFVCKNMKKTLVEDVYNRLKFGGDEITIEPAIFEAAAGSLKRMMELNR